MSVIWIKNKLIYFQTKNNVLILICQMFLFCWILLCCPKHSELAFLFRKLRQLQEKRKFTKWIKETKKYSKNHKVNQGNEKKYAKIRKVNQGNEKIFKLFWILGLQRKCCACNMGIELREFMINQNQCFWHRQLHSWEDESILFRQIWQSKNDFKWKYNVWNKLSVAAKTPPAARVWRVGVFDFGTGRVGYLPKSLGTGTGRDGYWENFKGKKYIYVQVPSFS